MYTKASTLNFNKTCETVYHAKLVPCHYYLQWPQIVNERHPLYAQCIEVHTLCKQLQVCGKGGSQT
jgi:hypothetical protein